jgi:alpha-glucosidase
MVRYVHMQAGEHGKIIPWYRKGALYQIYPLSFADSSGDGYGDLRGIIDHLDYLAGTDDSLGVAAVWLSPIFRSPLKDFGYDISDFRDIDPVFGTMKDFYELVAGVHKRGMKLLLDFVPNHTSDQHAWFREARISRSSSKRDWYIWADAKADGSPPNNWLSRFGGSAWELDVASGQYYLHTFLSSQPDLNWRNPEVRAEMSAVLRYWIDRGVDGFRTDAVYVLIKDDLLRDDPPNLNYRPGIDDPADSLMQTYSAGQSQLLGLLEDFCDAVALDGGTFMVSEAYLGIDQMKQLYRACKIHPIHAPFNFNLMTLPWGASSFGDWIDAYEDSLGHEDVPNYVLGNHDRPRLASRVGIEKARLLSLLQLTLRGMPVIYYGEELGMENANLSKREEKDPWGIRVPGLGLGRDIARGPMQWSGKMNAGFSMGKPWLPMGPDTNVSNVESQSREPESMLSMYKQLIHLKLSIPAIQTGKYRRLKTDNPEIYAFIRGEGNNRCVIVINFSENTAVVSIEGNLFGELLCSTHSVDGRTGTVALAKLKLQGFEGQLYEIKRPA